MRTALWRNWSVELFVRTIQNLAQEQNSMYSSGGRIPFDPVYLLLYAKKTWQNIYQKE